MGNLDDYNIAENKACEFLSFSNQFGNGPDL
jgi:hypothetical protein